MHHLSIIHELLQEQPAQYRKLLGQRTLLREVQRLALVLQESHQAWMEQLEKRDPKGSPLLRASQALEMALRDLQESLPGESSTSEEEGELGEAIAFLRMHTPTT